MSCSPDHITVWVETRPLDGSLGHGLFLGEPVSKGTVVIMFGGRATPIERFRELSEQRQRRSIQISDDVYMVGEESAAPGDFINHSCDPSLTLVGEITLAAARDLDAGDQLTYDYGTSDASPYDEFECECNSPRCRQKVTGEDWMDRALQERYRGSFSPYIQRKIDALSD